MLRRLDAVTGQSSRPIVRFEFNGRPVECRAGDSVAAALLASGHDAFRETAISGRPRGPWCMMGVCYECLVTIDGQANRQACMTPVRDGMRVEQQHGAREVGP